MAQETDAQLATRSLVIRNEVATNGNTKERHDDMNQALIDSKINNDKIDTDAGLATALKTVPGRDAVKAYITAALAALVGGAPGALDTLNELAAALADDANFAATVTSSLAGKENTINAAVALVDSATIDITAPKHTLSTALGRTFTISYSGDTILLEVTLTTTTVTFTFPASSLCVSEGVASNDNTCPLSGVSGDKYILSIKKVGSVYYVICKNFGQ